MHRGGSSRTAHAGGDAARRGDELPLGLVLSALVIVLAGSLLKLRARA